MMRGRRGRQTGGFETGETHTGDGLEDELVSCNSRDVFVAVSEDVCVL